MVVTTTNAAALAAGSALAGVPSDERAPSLFLLTVLAGLATVAALAYPGSRSFASRRWISSPGHSPWR